MQCDSLEMKNESFQQFDHTVGAGIIVHTEHKFVNQLSTSK